ncbi:oligomerization domain protein [Ehrlichia chaffeensis str. Heartland]|uniref:Ribosomal silencing factor RsfS n=1 Tax=Ehrlichia chaffeensis (strain ATCC CRL-10679 / Arkansas) TaxID=205920 RepID=Q2GHB7_EHRCR|nr:ribosome silencing factor [Ehrlichia chaffeensis]ABD44496.1 iojap-related protein [Ehrlichia chaffeensis str. Arkansas]AHX03460.1 oligomerization domain protein [Ehrlichia chaffeensis str. Heartland]AHX05820.1 oligomerization domain protein [Ehrlichia chaffeensis str. Jax]AHX06812.1 oligomerization domain protein [Ehrlichia chaffeensis str. Liberty]AHX07167.1 oligomerization domain protein [Ehrlichia chaffeensis str. Osceola]
MNLSKSKKPFSSPEELKELIVFILDKHKANNIVTINISNKSNLAEHLIIASGESSYHVKSLAERIRKEIKPHKKLSIEGLKDGNWVVINCYNILIHIFRPEVREYYQLENLWNSQVHEENEKL